MHLNLQTGAYRAGTVILQVLGIERDETLRPRETDGLLHCRNPELGDWDGSIQG